MMQRPPTTAQVLAKLGIAALNAMQEEAALAIAHTPNTLLLSPTGSGKTLAFLLPIVQLLRDEDHIVQALVIAPTRELAIQIHDVARAMATGYKVNVVYGGRPMAKDKQDIQQLPSILIGTPGRVADHLRRGHLAAHNIHTLVLDEFDKSLEIGFEEELKEIFDLLSDLDRRVLTSATQGAEVPDFVGFQQPTVVDYLKDGVASLTMRRITSPDKDKLDRLYQSLCFLGEQRGIVFLNYKDSIRRVSDYLDERGVAHGCFYGGMEQKEREQALIQFRNGTHRVLLATDLAARGIDVPAMDFIIHYHLPLRAEEFTHRNGRTARMHQEGVAYVLHWAEEDLPDFVPDVEEEPVGEADAPSPTAWVTAFVSGGRRDKISKGDIAGHFYKVGGIKKGELGQIELKPDCAFVAIPRQGADRYVRKLDNTRIKKRKVRVRLLVLSS